MIVLNFEYFQKAIYKRDVQRFLHPSTAEWHQSYYNIHRFLLLK